MEFIGRQNELLDFFNKKYYLLSSSIQSIFIYNELKNLTLCIDIELRLMKDNKIIKLCFREIQEYSFYYYSNLYFYNIEILKFFLKDGMFYISFDPTNEKEEIDEDDQDFIKSFYVEGWID